MGDEDVEAAAEELYRLDPGEFTARRGELAKDARSAGDRPAATRIVALRRPTVAAWAVNQAVREPVPELDELLEVADTLREAQAALDGPRLKQLDARRQGLERVVVRHVRDVARERGQDLTASVLTEVEQTLRAAASDPQAARAVASGRLTRALAYVGFGDVDLADAVATPMREGGAVRDELAPRRRARAASSGTAKRGTAKSGTVKSGTAKTGKAVSGKAGHQKDGRENEEQRAERQRAERQRAERERAEQQRAERLRELQEALRQARGSAAAADRAVTEAEEAEQDAVRLVEELHRRLDEARAEVTAAGKRAASAGREQQRAHRAVRAAERDLDRARD
ncbi:hypothetical protein [Thalassiella azotivora]